MLELVLVLVLEQVLLPLSLLLVSLQLVEVEPGWLQGQQAQQQRCMEGAQQELREIGAGEGHGNARAGK